MQGKCGNCGKEGRVIDLSNNPLVRAHLCENCVISQLMGKEVKHDDVTVGYVTEVGIESNRYGNNEITASIKITYINVGQRHVWP